jgi:uncharacterized membrane protein YdfJ with MMPL/SSD domain
VTADAAIIVFARADGGKLTSADSAQVASVATELNARHITNILGVTAGPASPNKLVQTALVSMDNSVLNGTSTAAGDAIKVLRADIKPLMHGSTLTEGVTGTAAQQLDSQQSGNNAEKIVTIATLALILILLLVIFRSPIIALLPLIVIAVVSQVATGLISDVNTALHLNADSSVTTLLIVVLFGIGTDYILFLMFRYRERLRAGEDDKQAMVSAVTRVGEVIASAAGVVIVAFLALLLSTLSLFRSLGPTLAIAVAVTLLAGLTLVPTIVAAGAEGRPVRRHRPRRRAAARRLRGHLRTRPRRARDRGVQLQADVRPGLGGDPVQRRVRDRTGHAGKGAAAGRDRPDADLPAHEFGFAVADGDNDLRRQAQNDARGRCGGPADGEQGRGHRCLQRDAVL